MRPDILCILVLVAIGADIFLHLQRDVKQASIRLVDGRGISRRGNASVTLTTTPTTSTLKNDGKDQCLSLDPDSGSMDKILSEAQQIFLLMPAKAAGSSMKQFTARCMKVHLPDNFANNERSGFSVLTQSLKLPRVIASHSSRDSTLIELMQNVPRHSVIFYIHRDETERLKSAIKHVLKMRVCPIDPVQGHTPETREMVVSRNGTDQCVLYEASVTKMIQKRWQEIGFGAEENLSCNTYLAIEEHLPDMYFMHYSQASKLQRLIAKYHCPELMTSPIVVNTDEQKKKEVHLLLENKNSTVSIDTWLHEKSNLIEWLLRMRKRTTCRGKTRLMEESLSMCPDQTIKLHR